LWLRSQVTLPALGNCLRRLGNPREQAENIHSKALEVQFQRLIREPLAEMPSSQTEISTRIIVVDALDECKDDNNVRLICGLLSQLEELRTVRLRVLLTSRSAYHIANSFRKVSHRSLSLLDFSDETKSDISAFLEKRLLK
jgi:hypothetical protein